MHKNDIHLRPNIKNILISTLLKLNPMYQIRNPVIFIVYLSSFLLTAMAIVSFFNQMDEQTGFMLNISVWLWASVLFSNMAESIAELQGKARSETLRKNRYELKAKKLNDINQPTSYNIIAATQLKKNDYVLVEKDDVIPSDGQVIKGVASVDESAITGESAAVIRESGGDRDAVTGGTVILSDQLIIRVSTNAGETFLDKMICLIENAKRQKSPNEIALTILLAGLSLIFLMVISTLLPFSLFSMGQNNIGQPISLTILIALLVCLIPTTIGGLLSAIGIAGMCRLMMANVIATSGKAVEAAGDVTLLLLDKTGTLTMGNRQAVNLYNLPSITLDALAQAAVLSSLADETPEGKSIVKMAYEKFKIPMINIETLNATFIPFSAQTRLSGTQLGDDYILKGAPDEIMEQANQHQKKMHPFIKKKVDEISRKGSTPLLVAKNYEILGIIELKDVIKPRIKQRLAELRSMGIKSLMVTGDNPLTAAAISAEAGVDDFHAQSNPEQKLDLIKKFHLEGYMIAMMGDGTNDAPALAHTDVAIAMNSGTQAAKEAANMVDLDSDPTKLIEIVKIGKQLLITRGALTTFSLMNDVAKYFAIIPAAFASQYPLLNQFNIMHLSSPKGAILSAVIFNALIIVFLLPLALRGINYKMTQADIILRNNIFIFGLGGLITPFIGIKLIDLCFVQWVLS